ncbi:hypothetical protein [Mycolicibacterium sphagni]|uniref:hypothetical protein n=1 Tax=Mycolicibacterium sphagni TaxID=1786 RepID=UPI0021F2AD0C|nr:hypothetical protein [Mycolicibacterium sphagni]MCV7175443.1 hypothetical protein [Mycolicibacterium sphagni]
MKGRDNALLVCLLIASVALLGIARHAGDPQWLKDHLPAAQGGDGILWQVQTTFLSVGFAGLAIAAQLFAESPLAIGASRARVLEHIEARRFVAFGLGANVVIGIETIWLTSGLGVLGISLIWFVPTVALLVVSTLKLVNLFGHPTQVDVLIRTSLAASLASRLEEASSKYLEATKHLDGLFAPGGSLIGLGSSVATFRVPVSRAGEVVKAIKPAPVRQARSLLAFLAADIWPAEAGNAGNYMPPQITRDVEPGDRTRLAETAFRVYTPGELDARRQDLIIRILQASIEFEPEGAVTPDEEMGREIAHLKDAVGTSIRSGAFSTAERALELLGHVIRGVWLKNLDDIVSSRRGSLARRDLLFRSIGEVEQDASLSPRVAGMFVDQAMKRALEAPRTGSSEYVDECLRSFTRIWLDVLRQSGLEFDQVPSQIVICVQNLAAYAAPDQREALSTRATWAMVELVKLALDAHNTEAAILAANALGGLFQYSDRDGIGRKYVRAGQLVLAGWLDYLADKGDDRNPTDAAYLRKLVTPGGTKADIVDARHLTERGETPFSRWDLWETIFSGSVRAQVLELSYYVDKAQLAALALADGPLPSASNQGIAAEYQRLVQLLDQRDSGSREAPSELKVRLNDRIAEWNAAENERLANARLSGTREDALRNALAETLDAGQRLANEIPRVGDLPADSAISLQILAMNFQILRHYLVDDTFNQTYADPAEIGGVIAGVITDREEHRIIELLRSLQDVRLEPSVGAIHEQIDALGDQAQYYVLLTPYGGLVDLDSWYTNEFSEALTRVIHIETSVLEDEAILFDSRTTLVSYRGPEEKEGLTPVGDTLIALGVFEDVQERDEPQVRIEVGEYFVLWPGGAPRVSRFGVDDPTTR